MYFEVFNRNHPDSNLLALLEVAIKDQKFIFEPAGNLLDHVEGIENLWDELTQDFYQKKWGAMHNIHKEVTAPVSFSTYLLNNYHRFFRHEGCRHEFRSKAERAQILEAQIKWLQEQVERLRNSTETLDEENARKIHEMHVKAETVLQGFPNMFQWNLQFRRGVLTFGKWGGMTVYPGMLDRD